MPHQRTMAETTKEVSELLTQLPLVFSDEEARNYVASLVNTPGNIKAEHLGIAIWCSHMISQCKTRIEEMFEREPRETIGTAVTAQWDDISNNLAKCHSQAINIMSSHMLHLKWDHSLGFREHIKNGNDVTDALVNMANKVMEALPSGDLEFEVIGQEGVGFIAMSILD